jgi:PHD-finger
LYADFPFYLSLEQTCFGKHNSEYLLLCDYCDQESHTYCLIPQLTEIPEEAWYCGSCINLGLVKSDPSETLPTELNSEEGEGTVDTLSAVPSDATSHLTHR